VPAAGVGSHVQGQVIELNRFGVNGGFKRHRVGVLSNLGTRALEANASDHVRGHASQQMVVAVGRQHANPANRQKWRPGDFGGNNPVSHDRGRSSTAGNAQAIWRALRADVQRAERLGAGKPSGHPSHFARRHRRFVAASTPRILE
jgi:hypothetical protein